MRARSASERRRRLATLLRGLRVRAGLRQVDVAKRVGESQSYVSKYEAAEQRLDLVELERISRALGVELCHLVRMYEGSIDPPE